MGKPNSMFTIGQITGTITSHKNKVITGEKALNDIAEIVKAFNFEWDEYFHEKYYEGGK